MRVFKIMSRNARAFRTTIGMSLQQFNFLMRDVEKAYPEAEGKRLEHPGRVRGVGAGRPFSLYPWDRVLLVLMYYRRCDSQLADSPQSGGRMGRQDQVLPIPS